MPTTYPKVLLSITSIPRRFDSSLREVIASLQDSGEQVVLCLPDRYKKWGAAPPPDYLKSYDNVELFRPSQDYGPATKLLGAIEYIETSKRDFDAVVTLDDDQYYSDARAAIDYLKDQARGRPGCVITIGGLKLEHYPYRTKNGLYGNNVGYVDAVAGFRGVYYPTEKIVRDRRIFDYASELPEGIFHDDDAYFGICCSRMGVPIYAVKPPKRTADGRPVALLSAQGCGDSAVQEQAPRHRVANEMEIYQYAVSQGWLPNRRSIAFPESPVKTMLKRSGLGRKLLRWSFHR